LPDVPPNCFQVGIEIDHVAIALGPADQPAKDGVLATLLVYGEQVNASLKAGA
jgi:hypothetical protein